MSAVLWDWNGLLGAAGAAAEGSLRTGVTGISIDTRTLAPGDLFVALAGGRDGHEFVGDAFRKGAAAALVSRSYVRAPGDGALARVDDTLRGLERLGRAARRRLPASVRIVAVTGSAGKTGTKEMLRLCLSRLGETHAAEKSFNNHWGVPLTLARMPASVRFGVFEIGMNHAGEIAPLARLVRPHAAIVTTIAPVHLAHFASLADIADAKAEIFEGLEPGGAAILNRDNPYFGRLAARAGAGGARLVSFGQDEGADVRLVSAVHEPERTCFTASVLGRSVSGVLGAPGPHLVLNALAVLAAVAVSGGSVGAAAEALAAFRPLPGRGERVRLAAPSGPILLIDESYNANPASMRAALAGVALIPRESFPRRIAVLGDMLELGPEAGAMHEALAGDIASGGIDLVFACGPHMRRLFEALPFARRGAWAETSEGLTAPLLGTLTGGDAVMIKGSLGSRMGPLVAAVRESVQGQRAQRQ